MPACWPKRNCPRRIKPEGVLALGIQAAADDSWLVAQVVDGTGKFRFVDLRRNEVVKVADGGPPESPYGPRKPRQPPRTLLGAAPSGPSDFTLCWSDGVVSLVHTAAKMEDGGKILEFPKLFRGDGRRPFSTDPGRRPGQTRRAGKGGHVSHQRGLVPLRGALPRAENSRHAANRGPNGRQIRDEDRPRTGNARSRDGDRHVQRRQVALRRHGRRIAAVVEAGRRALDQIATSCRRRRRKRALHRYSSCWATSRWWPETRKAT